jgi:magnesium-transporting ATPase (P-type)
MYLVSLIVLCIAEGLNLVVTISLSYSTTQLSKNKCFVRTFNAPEVMAVCNDLCTDLTSEIAVLSPNVT